jgi:hypothetical protein
VYLISPISFRCSFLFFRMYPESAVDSCFLSEFFDRQNNPIVRASHEHTTACPWPIHFASAAVILATRFPGATGTQLSYISWLVVAAAICDAVTSGPYQNPDPQLSSVVDKFVDTPFIKTDPTVRVDLQDCCCCCC